MRKNKVYLLISTITIYFIMLCINLNVSNAQGQVELDPNSNPNEFPTKYCYYTKIERWSDKNDLQIHENDYYDSTYTRELYCTPAEHLFDTNYYTSISYDGSSYTIGSEYNGTDIYIVEVFELNMNNFSYSDFTVGEEREYDFPSPTTISLNISGSTMATSIATEAMKDYSPTTDSYTLKIQSKYQSETPDEESRDIYIYPYLEKDGTKIANIDLGTITLPVFYYSLNLTATGTGMPAGYFYSHTSILNSSDGISIVESTYGSAVGDLGRTENDSYSALQYSEFINPSSISMTYNSSDSNSYSNDFTLTEANGGISFVNTGNNVWKKVLTKQLESNVSIANGIFYNVVPFVLIAIVAVLGIVILKKNSIK